MDKTELKRLAKRAASGDKAAWERLYRAIAALTEAVCRKNGLSREDCENVTQETALALSKNLRRLSAMANPGGYIRRVAANKCVDIIRAEKKLPENADLSPDGLLLGMPDTAPTPENEVADLSPDRLIDDFLAELPEEQRICLTMRYMDGYSNRRIAERLGLPIGTVASRIRYAKQSLKKRVTEYEKAHRVKLHAMPFLPWSRFEERAGRVAQLLGTDGGSAVSGVTRVVSGTVAAVVIGSAVLGTGVVTTQNDALPAVEATAPTAEAAARPTAPSPEMTQTDAPIDAPAASVTAAPTRAAETAPAASEAWTAPAAVVDNIYRTEHMNITFDDVEIPAYQNGETVFTPVEAADTLSDYTYSAHYGYSFDGIIEKLSGTVSYADPIEAQYAVMKRFDSGNELESVMGMDIDSQGSNPVPLEIGDNTLRINVSGQECEINVRVIDDDPAATAPYVTDLWVYLAEIPEGEVLTEEPRFTAVLHDSAGEHIIGNDNRAQIRLEGLVIEDIERIPELKRGSHVLKAQFLGAQGDLRLRVRAPKIYPNLQNTTPVLSVMTQPNI